MVDIQVDLNNATPDPSPNARRLSAKKELKSEEEDDEGEQFVRRRLSVAQHIDLGEDVDDMDA